MKFAAKLREEFRVHLDFINLGGGFAIPFAHKVGLPTVQQYAEVITSELKSEAINLGLDEMELFLEPGGALVGDSAILLLKVGMTKTTPGLPRWIGVDGGANVILRASQGWYTYHVVAANRMRENASEVVNIAGPLCYSGDVIARERKMPKLVEGDLLVMLDTGAYTYAYEFHGGAGSYPLPPIVLINNEGEDELVRRGEKVADITSRDIIPERLRSKHLSS
jgi:diaminopimelate decarboxylase